MKTLVVSSLSRNAGKTSLILGLARNCDGKIGYMKPLGDRLYYKKKRLWDHDAALMVRLFKLSDAAEDITLGFEHAKLRYVADEAGIGERVKQAAARIAEGKDLLFVEGGASLTFGCSIQLDSVALARHLNAELLAVASGAEDAVMDGLRFLKRQVNLTDVRFKGAVINQVEDVEDFKSTYAPELTEANIPVLGIIPYVGELGIPTAQTVADALFAKVIAGEEGLMKRIERIFVGAMSPAAVKRYPEFELPRKLVITSGDRSDMILTALEGDTSAIVLTHNIVPPSNIISKATDRKVPLLLVKQDTFQAAKVVDDMDRLISWEEPDKIDLLAQLVKDHVDMAAITGADTGA